jgi:methionine-rich copper-binding protein CopC
VFAHAHLKSQTPAADSTVAAPTELRLVFSEGVEAAFTKVTISKDGATVAVKPGHRGQRQEDPGGHTGCATPGAYKVEWHAVSVDTHKSEGAYSSRWASNTWRALVLCRFLHFTVVLMLFGAWVSSLGCWAVPTLDRTLTRIWRVGWRHWRWSAVSVGAADHRQHGRFGGAALEPSTLRLVLGSTFLARSGAGICCSTDCCWPCCLRRWRSTCRAWA